APLKELQTKFGFTPENVVNAARTVLRRQQTNPLKILQNYGQSVWLDFIRRTLITSGELQRLLDEDELRGVTSNPAIFEKLDAGVSVNVRLLFAPVGYQRAATAFIEGLGAFGKAGGDVSHVASVASFFIRRIDALIDARVGERLKTSTDAMEAALLRGLLGKVAIANAKLTYQRYKEIYAGPRWQALAARGAQTQRLLWASTSTKNANYRDVGYGA